MIILMFISYSNNHEERGLSFWISDYECVNNICVTLAVMVMMVVFVAGGVRGFFVLEYAYVFTCHGVCMYLCVCVYVCMYVCIA